MLRPSRCGTNVNITQRVPLRGRGRNRSDDNYAYPMDERSRPPTPEQTIVTWARHLPANATILDVAAGSGRHALWFLARGHQVTAIDCNTAALHAATLRTRLPTAMRIVQADLEKAPWPLPGERFDAIVVVNYLWRELLPILFASVAIKGHLLYDTFAVGNARYGRPRNPDFLLRDNELRAAVPAGFEILDFAHGAVGNPPTAVRQRLLAQRTH